MSKETKSEAAQWLEKASRQDWNYVALMMGARAAKVALGEWAAEHKKSRELGARAQHARLHPDMSFEDWMATKPPCNGRMGPASCVLGLAHDEFECQFAAPYEAMRNLDPNPRLSVWVAEGEEAAKLRVVGKESP